MKDLIKRIISEALGVPEGILESGEKVYELLGDKLKTLPSVIGEKKTYHIKADLKISDFFIKKLIININFTEIDSLNKVELYSMSFASRSSLNDEKYYMVNIINNDTVEMMMNFAGPENTSKKDIVEYYKNNKTVLISTFAHELGHSFNQYKQKIQTIKSSATYAGYQKTSFPFQTINQFLFNLYYIHSVENIVRPIEVASMMRSGDIDREKFHDFLLNNETYLKLKKINSFSYQKLRDELENDVSRIAYFLKKIGVKKEFKTSDEVIDELLKIVYINISNNSIQTAREMLTTSPFEEILGFQTRKENFFRKLVNSFAKYDESFERFYKREERNMKIVSEKMMKKLIKLWDLAKVNPESIKNWDLHHKINKTGEQIETEIRFKKKK